MTNLKICNYVTAFLAALVGAAIAWTSYGYGTSITIFGPGAGFWPFFLGLALIFVAVLIVYDTIRHKDEFTNEKVVLWNPEIKGVYSLMGLTIVFVCLVPLLGFYPAAFLFMCVMQFVLGARRIGVICTISLVFLAAVFVVFSTLLSITLPSPFFLE